MTALIFFLELSFNKKENLTESQSQRKKCVITIEERVVRGYSLSPFIKDGETVKFFPRYYDCYAVKREDIVLYNYAGDQDPLIKIVKALPGDKFNLQKADNGWNIIVNEKVLKNSAGETYLIVNQGYQMLSLYEKDYQGVIPQNAYLLLGNLANGSLDSTRFGLVDKSDILGKAEKLP